MSKRKKKEKKRKRGAAARKRAEIHKSGYTPTAVKTPEGIERFKEKAEKQYRLDIIPFVLKETNDYADKGELYWELTYYAHFNIGADNNSYICPKQQIGEKCPICQYRTKLARDPDADEELIASLRPKQRQLFRIMDRKNPDVGIQLWDISFHNFGKQLDARIRNSDEEDRYDEFYELEDGFTLKVGFAEKSFRGNKFPEAESIDFKSRKEDLDEDVLEEGPDLDECLIILDFDELKQIFMQTEDEDDDEEKPKKKKSKKKKDEDEEEEETDDDLDDDDDDDTDENFDDDLDDDDDNGDPDTDDDLDDDDEDEDEDEDEEPKPKKKKKKKASKSKSKKKGKDKGKKDKKKSKSKEKKGKKNKCPAGGTFGEDNDELDECVDCPKWDACDAANNE